MLLANRLSPSSHLVTNQLDDRHIRYNYRNSHAWCTFVSLRHASVGSRQVRYGLGVPPPPVTVTRVAAKRGGDVEAEDDDEGDEEASVAGKPYRVERLLANLGYGKRRECQQLVKKGRVTRQDGSKLKVGEKVMWGEVVLEGEQLDPPSPLLLALHKPTGYVVTAPDDEKITDPVVYDLLPYRFGRRRPFLSCVGRLDKETSGLLLLTDDGTLLHRINSPKRGIWKVYEATLADPMTPKQAEAAARKFASGSIVLEGDHAPLLPAKLDMTGERSARVAICEGRYHQVRRMFTAVGNAVVSLRRVSVGGLTLGSLPEGEWRQLSPQDLEQVFAGPSSEEVMAGTAGADDGGSETPSGDLDADAKESGSGRSGSSAGASERYSASSERDGGATASSSSSDSGVRLTKKEKKKGRKKKGAELGSRDTRRPDEEEEEQEDEAADVELLALEEEDEEGLDAALDESAGYDDTEGRGRGGRNVRRRPRRPPAVRQGVVLDNKYDRDGGSSSSSSSSSLGGLLQVDDMGAG
ncbi:hypothetical protein Agub_g8871, partial [Astrephomene gubernaculifera]